MADQNLNIRIAAIDRTQRAFASIKKGLGSVTRALFSFRTAILGAVGVGGLGLLVKSSLDGIDKISKLSRTLGISVQDLRKLELAADLSGIQLDTLARGVRTLNKGMVDFVQEGTGEAKDAFERLGVSADDLRGVMGDQFKVLELVADRLQTVENSALRSSIAQELFGGRASELLLVLEEGAEGLAKIAQEAQDFGLVLSTATARNVEEANDAFTRLGSLFKGLRDTLVGALAPAFQFIADTIRKKVLVAIQEAGGVEKFGKSLAISIITIFQKAFQAIVNFSNSVGRQFNRLLDFVREVADAINIDLDPALKKLEFVPFKNLTTIFDDLIKSVEGTTNSVMKMGVAGNESGEDVDEAMKKVLMTMEDVRFRGITSLEDALVGLATRTTTVTDAFRSMARSIIADLARIAIQQQITGPLAQLMGFTVPNLPGKATGKAIGGPVQRGQPYLVGERGPEMFVPSRSGSIIPNGDIAGGGVVVNQSINISTGVSATVRSEIASLLPQIAEASKAAVLDARRRGGSFSAAFS